RERLHDRTEGGVEVRAVARGNSHRRIDGELAIIGAECFTPARFSLVVERRRGVTEEAEIDGLARARADFCHLLAELLRIEHRAWERPERARLRRGRREFPIHGAGHWRLHDRKLDLEQLDETASGHMAASPTMLQPI